MLTLKEILVRLAEAYHRGRRLGLLLDYDGTLVPFAEHPAQARLDREGRRVLRRLAGRPRVDVAIVSGRTIDDLAEILKVRRLHLAGSGGMELRLSGRRMEHPCAEQAAAATRQVVKQLQALVDSVPGAWIEDKRLAMTVHYRAVPKSLIAEVRGLVIEAVTGFATPMRIVEGPKALEISVEGGWHKGTAAEIILDHVGSEDTLLLYAGDGANDADAMETVAAWGGITIGVGPCPPPMAGFCLPGPTALLTVLACLDELLKPATGRQPVADSALALHAFWRSSIPM